MTTEQALREQVTKQQQHMKMQHEALQALVKERKELMEKLANAQKLQQVAATRMAVPDSRHSTAGSVAPASVAPPSVAPEPVCNHRCQFVDILDAKLGTL